MPNLNDLFVTRNKLSIKEYDLKRKYNTAMTDLHMEQQNTENAINNYSMKNAEPNLGKEFIHEVSGRAYAVSEMASFVITRIREGRLREMSKLNDGVVYVRDNNKKIDSVFFKDVNLQDELPENHEILGELTFSKKFKNHKFTDEDTLNLLAYLNEVLEKATQYTGNVGDKSIFVHKTKADSFVGRTVIYYEYNMSDKNSLATSNGFLVNGDNLEQEKLTDWDIEQGYFAELYDTNKYELVHQDPLNDVLARTYIPFSFEVPMRRNNTLNYYCKIK